MVTWCLWGAPIMEGAVGRSDHHVNQPMQFSPNQLRSIANQLIRLANDPESIKPTHLRTSARYLQRLAELPLVLVARPKAEPDRPHDWNCNEYHAHRAPYCCSLRCWCGGYPE